MEFTIRVVLYFPSKYYEMQKSSDEIVYEERQKEQMKNADLDLDASILRERERKKRK